MIHQFGSLAESFEKLDVPRIFEAADHQLRGRVHVAEHRRVATVFASVVHRVEVAAAAPVLVTDAPQPHTERIGRAVSAALAPQRGIQAGVAVLQPVRQLLWSTATDVASEVWLRANLLAQPQELVSAEAVVVLHLQAARHAQSDRPLLGRPNAISPVIVIRVAAARPTQQWHRQGFERVEHILAEAFGVWNRTLAGADPQALI